MNETSIIAIVLSLITVCGTLSGVWFGRLLERSNETRKWRRERCLEAYTEVLKSCDILIFEADRAYGIECESIEFIKQKEIVLHRTAEMYRTTDRAFLLGSQLVHKKLNALALYCGEEIAAKSIQCPKFPDIEWTKIRITDYAITQIDFLNTARNDLEVFSKLYSYHITGLFIKKSLEELNEQLSNGTISPGIARLRIKELKKQWKKEIKEQKNKFK